MLWWLIVVVVTSRLTDSECELVFHRIALIALTKRITITTKYHLFLLALAKSIGWMITLANVAAEPPQTNGSAMVAIPPFFSGIVSIRSRYRVGGVVLILFKRSRCSIQW